MDFPTAPELKAEAEEHLTALLKTKNKFLSGLVREITILAMCSFACERVLSELIAELGKPKSTPKLG